MRKTLLFCVIIFAVFLIGCSSPEVKTVESYINKIGAVTLENDKIVDARVAYDALNSFDKEDVKNYSTLLKSEAEYVDLLILNDYDNPANLEMLVAAYESLPDDAKDLVKNESYLSQAKVDFINQEIIDIQSLVSVSKTVDASIIDLLDTITQEYNTLDQNDQKKIKNYESILDLKSRAVAALCEEMIADGKYDSARELLENNRSILSDDQLFDCMKCMGMYLCFENAKSLVQSRLLDPASFSWYTMSLRNNQRIEKNSYYEIYHEFDNECIVLVEFNYSGTNMLGGIARQDYSDSWFYTVDLDNLSIINIMDFAEKYERVN